MTHISGRKRPPHLLPRQSPEARRPPRTDGPAPADGDRHGRGRFAPAPLRNRSYLDYRGYIRNHYDGLAGALTGLTGLVTGHAALAGRLVCRSGFDVRGCKRILDAACGDGRYSKFLMRQADPDAVLTSFDLSAVMLRRARRRLGGDRVSHAVADLTRLPYPDGCFDAIVCGWVLEHLPDPRMGLRELARVLAPGGKLLLMTTEDTFSGRLCCWLWKCQSYNRRMLRQAIDECGLRWRRELWFSGLHRRLRLGGIVVELGREGAVHA
ncbi:MAG: class I SAM-dependent methyltransferase [Gemmataceae bacterium]